MAESVYDQAGNAYTFDLWRLWAGWDGGTIHDALRAFKSLPMAEKDRFCTFLLRHLDNGQIKDLENGYASCFFKSRIG